MKNARLIMAISTATLTMLLVPVASATVLTFDVEDENTYIGSEVVVQPLYGYRVDDPDRYSGNYLQGTGWTPNVTVQYAAHGSSQLQTADYPAGGDIDIPVTNGDFETGTPYQKGTGLPPWVWGHNVTGGYENFYMEPRHGSTAPPEPDTWPNDGQYHCATFYQGGWAYNDLTHVILPETQYTVAVDVRGNGNGPTGWVGIQVYAGAAHATFLSQNGRSDANDIWVPVSTSFTTPASGGGVGEVLALRLVQQDGHTDGTWHWACVDDVRISIPGDSGELWDKVAKLSWDTLDDATWDFVLTPDRGFALDLNSFELDPRDADSAEAGNWTVYQGDENGPVIDSGSWLDLPGNSVVNVTMSPYAGTVLLRLNITAGLPGRMAVDNINFDQVELACDDGYQLAWDFDPDCIVNLLDLSVFAFEWMKCNDPTDMNCEPTW